MLDNSTGPYIHTVASVVRIWNPCKNTAHVVGFFAHRSWLLANDPGSRVRVRSNQKEKDGRKVETESCHKTYWHMNGISAYVQAEDSQWIVRTVPSLDVTLYVSPRVSPDGLVFTREHDANAVVNAFLRRGSSTRVIGLKDLPKCLNDPEDVARLVRRKEPFRMEYARFLLNDLRSKDVSPTPTMQSLMMELQTMVKFYPENGKGDPFESEYWCDEGDKGGEGGESCGGVSGDGGGGGGDDRVREKVAENKSWKEGSGSSGDDSEEEDDEKNDGSSGGSDDDSEEGDEENNGGGSGGSGGSDESSEGGDEENNGGGSDGSDESSE